jgi:hypothetical protein
MIPTPTEPHHERYCLIANSSTYPFALSLSKGDLPFFHTLRERVRVRVGNEGNNVDGINVQKFIMVGY